jgi:hypothetical protein
MQPGLYYTNKLNPILAAAEAKKAATEKAAKSFTKVAFRAVAAHQFKVSPKEIRLTGYQQSDVGVFSFPSGRGLRTEVISNEVGGAITQWLKNKDDIDARNKAACKARCDIAELLDNSHLKGFIARVRAIYGAKKDYSIAELDTAFADWTYRNAPHVCPR